LKKIILLCIFYGFVPQKSSSQEVSIKDSLIWVSMDSLVNHYADYGLYDSAIIVGKKSINFSKKIFGIKHSCYAQSLCSISLVYIYQEEYAVAETLLKKAVEVYKKAVGINHVDYAAGLSYLAILYNSWGNYNRAISLYLNALQIFEYANENQNTEYASLQNNLADVYQTLGNYTSALPLFKSSLAIRQKVVGENSEDYATSLNNLAGLYVAMGNYNLAEPLYKKAIEIIKDILGEEHPTYASFINNLAWLQSNMGKYVQSEKLYKEAIEIRKKVLGEMNSDYSASLNNLGILYETIGNYKGAELLFIKVLEIEKKLYGNDHPKYAISLNNYASLNETIGNFAKAEKLYKQALLINKNTFGTNNIDYALSINNLAYLYETMCNYPLAETLYKEALNIRQTTLGKNHPECAASFVNMASLYESKGNYYAAEKNIKTALSIYKNSLGINHPNYIKSESNLAILYHAMGNYTTAEALYKLVIKKRQELFGEAHPDYATSLNNLATLYVETKKYKEAELLFKQSLDINKKTFGNDHPNYANSLNNLASLYKQLKKYSEAETLYKEALTIRKNTLGELHTDYAISLNNLASLYEVQKKFKIAENLYKEALAINKKVLGILHPEYAATLNHLASLYYTSNQIQKWNSIIDTTIQTETKNELILLQNFSETEKENYLKHESYMQDIFLSMLYHFKTPFVNSFYKSTTVKQGWLLQGKQLLNSYAANTKDTAVKQLLMQWQSTKKIYSVAMQLTEEKRVLNNINIDSLEQQTENLEKKIIEAIPSLKSMIVQNGIDAKTVSNHLKNNEVVVHWVSFKYTSPEHDTDSTLYAAYIIKPNDSLATFITVFEETQLKKLLKKYYGGSGRSTIDKDKTGSLTIDSALYNLIWKPILPFIQNKNTIYNLPAGLLHKISFASLTDSNHNQLINQYQLHQFISINELFQPSSKSTLHKKISLFGGANFYATSTNTVQPASKNRNATENKNIQFNYLPGTKHEVETIVTNAKNTNWKIQSYLHSNASEDNFKKSSGTNAPTILHIATHGFYFTSTKKINDFPLLRSGLVLSGANNYWGKDTILKNKEDGIVTAQEISNLNLLNTDLVVLSACQTALGDITGSEGVYGLQRAFKMAGVKKLLMSLWEVPDAETAELMQLFYSHIFKGETYFNAFRKAQLALKLKYKDPLKWAGFVLVGE